MPWLFDLMFEKLYSGLPSPFEDGVAQLASHGLKRELQSLEFVNSSDQILGFCDDNWGKLYFFYFLFRQTAVSKVKNEVSSSIIVLFEVDYQKMSNKSVIYVYLFELLGKTYFLHLFM